MLVTAADLESVKTCEVKMDIDEITAETLSGLRFVTALNGGIVEEK